ncbi:MAG: L-rhamnose isomerase [Oscillospiraceae bacterium]|nr:L-rhamnose isomerase [Oscillospiraceae bacterium]
MFEPGQWADWDKLEPKHFARWVEFCKARGLGCDFNPTSGRSGTSTSAGAACRWTVSGSGRYRHMKRTC